MKNYIKMIIFVLVLGSATALLLGGMDMFTKDRIAENELAELKSNILEAYGISYTLGNIHEVFGDEVEEETHEGITFFIDVNTGSVSYVFEGNGVWGPIIGVITLKSDFETIQKITILQQEETPGLGGVIAESKYLENYVNKKMEPSLAIVKAPEDSPNEVVAISGATRTSNAFQTILNTSYAEAKTAWGGRNG